MHRSEILMLRGTLAWCPDCADEVVLLPADDGHLCCTTCDAAVFVLDTSTWRGGRGLDRDRRAG